MIVIGAVLALVTLFAFPVFLLFQKGRLQVDFMCILATNGAAIAVAAAFFTAVRMRGYRFTNLNVSQSG